MPRFLPKGFQFFPDGEFAADAIVDLYRKGFAGAWKDPKATEIFRDQIGRTNGAMIAGANGFADSHAGKLVLPFLAILKNYPGCLPGPAQARGDCVSHSNKNAALTAMCCDIAAGVPDEKTGLVEGAPEVSAEGIKNGVLSTEASYWFRGYDGDGWSCSEAASVALKKAGAVLRQNYPDLGIDLTTYSGSLAGKYGRRSPPAEIQSEFVKHLVHDMTELESFEEVRDFLGNGFGVSSCGDEGFSDSRNEDGVAKRSGSWAHAMAYMGADDRQEIKQKYGEPLVLVQNSWAKWNDGPRRILGTSIDIPEGAFWAKWSDVKRRYVVAHSGVNGWQAKSIDWLTVFSPLGL